MLGKRNFLRKRRKDLVIEKWPVHPRTGCQMYESLIGPEAFLRSPFPSRHVILASRFKPGSFRDPDANRSLGTSTSGITTGVRNEITFS